MQPDPTSPLDLDAIRARFVVTENLDDGTKEYVDSLFWSSRDVPNLLAALAEAQRERDEAEAAGFARAVAIVRAQADLPSLVHFDRPSDFRKGVLSCLAALAAAVDTYETQEGTGV